MVLMKKLSLYIFLVLMFFNLANAERVTLGFIGDSCLQFNESKNKFGSEFEDLFVSELMGFLTGYNMNFAIQDGDVDRMKTLDHNSIEYAYSNIVEFCRKKPDNQVFLV